MKKQRNTYYSITLKATLLLSFVCFMLVSIASLGDGKKSVLNTPNSILLRKTPVKTSFFSLNSGYTFRGSEVISQKPTVYFNLNTTITYQQGNTTFKMPLTQKVPLSGRLTFNPNYNTRK